MQASVLRLLSSALVLLAGCVGRVEGNETFVEPTGSPTKDGGKRSDDLDAGGRPDARGEAGAAVGRPDECKNQQPLATGVRIREVALYQTVKVPLFDGNAWIDPEARSAAVVQGKAGLVRVLIETLPGFKPHAVRAVLRLKDGDAITDLVANKNLTDNSTDEDIDSSFNFDVNGKQLGANTELSLALEEPSCNSETGLAEDSLLPVQGFLRLQAAPIQPLKVVVVPINVNGRMPITDSKEVERMRTTLRAYYPVPDVEIVIREPLIWPSPVGATDNKSWTDLLNQIIRERQRDHVTRDVYYIGLVQPAATYGTYCQGGCILGMAPQTTRRMDSLQVALGASFADPQTYETMVHELGHAHGRGHSPCSEGSPVIGVDDDYPELDGATDSWGWDSRVKQLREPVIYKDIMGYCAPNWISTYTYRALAERSQEVNGEALMRGASVVIGWENVLLYADGSARWGGISEVSMPIGNAEPAEILDARGNVLQSLDIVRIPLSHTGDQILYIPRPGPDWAAVKLKDRVVTLSAIAAAR